MELNKSNKKEYDLSSIQELFNEMESPRQLADDLAQLILNYASLVTEDNIEVFKNDLSILSVCLCSHQVHSHILVALLYPIHCLYSLLACRIHVPASLSSFHVLLFAFAVLHHPIRTRHLLFCQAHCRLKISNRTLCYPCCYLCYASCRFCRAVNSVFCTIRHCTENIFKVTGNLWQCG